MNKLRQQLVAALANRLRETEPEPIAQLARICACMEPAHVLRLVRRVEAIERNGGMLIQDGTRRKTKGGVFFYLARTRKYGKLTKAQRRYCYPRYEPMDTIRHAA